MNDLKKLQEIVDGIWLLAAPKSLLERYSLDTIEALEQVAHTLLSWDEAKIKFNAAIDEVQDKAFLGKPEEREDAVACLHFYGLLHALIETTRQEEK